jgi:hypothetical protein
MPALGLGQPQKAPQSIFFLSRDLHGATLFPHHSLFILGIYTFQSMFARKFSRFLNLFQ